MKFLEIKTQEEGNNLYIEIMRSDDLKSLDMLHLLNHLIQKLAVIYKLPVQYLTRMLHEGVGGDLLTDPTEEEKKSINDLMDQIKKELRDMARRYEDEQI